MKRLIVKTTTYAGLVAACALMQACTGKQPARPRPVIEEQPPEIQVIDDVEVVATDTKAGRKTAAAIDKANTKVNKAATRIEAVDIENIAATTPYTVTKGDTLSAIAQRNGVRWQDIVASNPGLAPNKLRVGQVIQLPAGATVAAPETKKVTAPKTTAPKTTAKPVAPATAKSATPAAGTTYVVKSGDMLSKIAVAHGVKLSALRAANPQLKGDKIIVGQKLTIPAGAKKTEATAKAATTKTAQAKATAPKTTPPTVKKSEQKAAEVKKVEEKKPAEPAPVVVEAAQNTPEPVKVVETPKPVTVEQPKKVEPAPAKTDAHPTYTVKEGEDVYAVAIRWGVSPTEIKSLNNLTSTELKAGQVIKLPVAQ